MDRTDRATRIYCMIMSDPNGIHTQDEAVEMSVQIAYQIEQAVLDEERRRMKEKIV